MKKILFLLFVGASMMMSQKGNAQDYNTAVGLRFGGITAITGKKFLSERNAVEGIVGFRSRFGGSIINITGLYQFHTPIESVEGLKWYWGFGGNLYYYNYDLGVASDSSIGLGIAGVGGLDYSFKDIPLNLSLDIIPVFSLTGLDTGVDFNSVTLSARYILNPKK